MVREFESAEISSVVDLAGGEGRNALWFASRGAKAENVEFSAVALEKFESRAATAGLSELTLPTHADARSAKFQLKPDLLLICYLQLPISDLIDALDNALSQLPEEAQIFGVWHAKRNLTEGFGGPPNPALLPSPAELQRWADDQQLDAKVWEEEREVVTEAGKFTAIDVLLRAKRRS